MTNLFVAQEHHQLFWHWKKHQSKDIKLYHVDFHCDMRGLLIDRKKQQAAILDDHELKWVDQGNFLTHAVNERIITSLQWAHYSFGGRRYDQGTVAYESDPKIKAVDLKHKFFPFVFSEVDLKNWKFEDKKAHLDLDWDAFASHFYSQKQAQKNAKNFLDKKFVQAPEAIYLTFSPCSSRKETALFDDFKEALINKFNCKCINIEPLSKEHSTLSHYTGNNRSWKSHVPVSIKKVKVHIEAYSKRFYMRKDLEFPY